MRWRSDCRKEEKQLTSAWRGPGGKSWACAAAGKLRAVGSPSGWGDPVPETPFSAASSQSLGQPRSEGPGS